MRRRIVSISLSVTGALLVILMVALARVGTDLDRARINRDDLQFEVDDLNEKVDGLTTERDQLQQQLGEQHKTVEQLKVEAERVRKSQAASAAAAPAAMPSATPTTTTPATEPGTPAASLGEAKRAGVGDGSAEERSSRPSAPAGP